VHQLKPTAPITYLGGDGKRLTLPEDESQWPKEIRFMSLTLPEIALIQTLVNRSLHNCNCNLNKVVLKGVVDKIKDILSLYSVEEERINGKY
jgi:hypothetical protein